MNSGICASQTRAFRAPPFQKRHPVGPENYVLADHPRYRPPPGCQLVVVEDQETGCDVGEQAILESREFAHEFLAPSSSPHPRLARSFRLYTYLIRREYKLPQLQRSPSPPSTNTKFLFFYFPIYTLIDNIKNISINK